MIRISSIDELRARVGVGSFLLIGYLQPRQIAWLVEVVSGPLTLTRVRTIINSCVLSSWPKLIPVGNRMTFAVEQCFTSSVWHEKMWLLEEGDEHWDEACTVSMKLALTSCQES